MKSYDYIVMFKKNNDLGSDYQASKALGVSRQAISNYKNGRPLDEDLALPIAEDLGIEPSEILYVINSEKGKTIEIRRKWSKLSKMKKQIGSTSANLLINMALFMPAAVYCILC